MSKPRITVTHRYREVLDPCADASSSKSKSEKEVDYALITQRDRAVEALVWAHEKRDGWEKKVEDAFHYMPSSLVACFKR